MAATLFVKAGAEYIRVATSVLNPDGSGRAVGTVLGGAALGEVQVLGTPYIADYQPIKDASGSASSSSATKGDAATKGGSCPFRARDDRPARGGGAEA
jgi:Cache 3/Cache 2 fusion domain